jgi:hypothetical protein
MDKKDGESMEVDGKISNYYQRRNMKNYSIDSYCRINHIIPSAEVEIVYFWIYTPFFRKNIQRIFNMVIGFYAHVINSGV